jgi:hypothetical protein
LPLVLALLLAAGIAAAALLATRGDGSAQPAKRVTVTQHGTTVHETVTAQQPPTTAGSPPASPSGTALAQAGYAKLQAGDAAGALPLLQQAAEKLRGTGGLEEAYNDYNLAYALAKTQGCSQQVVDLLDASQAIQGHRSEINRLRAACRSHP